MSEPFSANLTTGEPDEEWRPVVGHEGRYEVSSIGRVRSLGRVVIRQCHDGRTIPQPVPPRLLKQRTVHGYAYVSLGVDGRNVELRVHRAVCEAFNGPDRSGMLCAHRNDVKSDNRAENLYWATYKENSADAIRNGRIVRGESNPSAKLKIGDIIAIRRRYADGEPARLIAADYPVCSSRIHEIGTHKSWRCVPEDGR